MQYKRAHDVIYVDDSINKGPHYEICTIDRSVPKWEEHANRITAAPNMLEALEEAACVLDDVLGYLDGCADVDDGDYGQQIPNKARRLQQQAKEGLEIINKAIKQAKGEQQ